MKRTLGTALAAVILFVISATPAFAGTTYGKGVSKAEPVNLADLLARPDAFVDKNVKVKGEVADVCTKAGCWIMVKDGEKTIRVKVKEGEIVFPKDAKGKSVVAEGVFKKLELTKEQAVAREKHFAEENGRTFDPASVTGPQTIYQIQGTGALID